MSEMTKYWEKKKLEYELDEVVNALVLTAKQLMTEHEMTVDEVNEKIQKQLSMSISLAGMGEKGDGKTIEIRRFAKINREEKPNADR